jgi:osmotically-inducible protein OsmY
MKQLVLIGAAALALGFAACTQDRSAPRDDMTISSEVRKELNDERIAGNIEVRADSGTVTLTGRCRR